MTTKIKNKYTGEIASAQYALTPQGNWRYYVNDKPLTDRKFDSLYEIISGYEPINITPSNWQDIERAKNVLGKVILYKDERDKKNYMTNVVGIERINGDHSQYQNGKLNRFIEIFPDKHGNWHTISLSQIEEIIS